MPAHGNGISSRGGGIGPALDLGYVFLVISADHRT
jgi:hypothetical protein